MILLTDVEANGLNPTKIHVICTKEKETGQTYTFTEVNDYFDYVLDIRPKVHVFHNGLGYDVPVINRLVSPGLIDPTKVIDTMVVSKTRDYKRYRTHSLKEIGEDLKVHKGDYDGGWDECTPEMIKYCEQDVEVLSAILDDQWPTITDPSWKDALRTEHDVAQLCYEMSETGFKFNFSLGNSLLKDITKEMDELESSFKLSFPPKLVEVNRLQFKYKKDGTLFSTVTNAIAKYPKTEVQGKELVCYDYKEFNPGSSKDRVDVLWDAGWNPIEKTEGHKKSLRKEFSYG